MADTYRFVDPETRQDLAVFLDRLQRFALPEVRLVVRGSVLAVFGCTQAPAHLLDSVAVVLVMRAFQLEAGPTAQVDRTVLVRSLLDRLAYDSQDPQSLALPDTLVTAAWTGVLPPAGGWQPAGFIDAESLSEVAQQGISRVAAALPEQPGEAVVSTVRAQVWGVEVAPNVPAAAAFALESMGFLRNERKVQLAQSRTWMRLSTSRGHVIVRHKLH